MELEFKKRKERILALPSNFREKVASLSFFLKEEEKGRKVSRFEGKKDTLESKSSKIEKEAPRGEGFTIEERINKLSSIGEPSYLESKLGLRFPSGAKIDLATFLPQDYRFEPGLREEGKEAPEFEIESYQNNQENLEFYLDPSLKKIGYGNLAPKGGLLNLLHEVSHSWQVEVSRGGNVRSLGSLLGFCTFVYFYEKFNKDKENLQEEHKDNPELAREKVIAMERGLRFVTEEMVGDFDGAKNLYQTLKKFEEDPRHKNEFIEIEIPWEAREKVKFPKGTVELILEKEAKDERTAWALAVRILRFLRRKKGVDLEPELKTLDDFRKIIYEEGLDTHQKAIELFIEQCIKGFQAPKMFSRRR